MADGMHKLSSVMEDSARRYRRLPVAAKLVFCLSLLFSVMLYGFIFHYFTKHDVTNDSFLDVPLCPACFGSSGCGLMYYNQVQLSGWSGYRFGNLFNTKNILYATLSGGQKVVLKKLGSDQEIQDLDDKVCQEAKRPKGCEVGMCFLVFLVNTKYKIFHN